MTSSYSVTTRDNPSKLGFSSRCSRAWPLFKLSLVSFSPLNTYIARYARVRRTEIYCAIARKLSHPTPNRVPSSLLEWPRCEGGRLVKLIYRTSLKKICLFPKDISDDSTVLRIYFHIGVSYTLLRVVSRCNYPQSF